MDTIEYLKNRIGILEMALGQLLTYELRQLQPYASERWHVLNDIEQAVMQQSNQNDKDYIASKDIK